MIDPNNPNGAPSSPPYGLPAPVLTGAPHYASVLAARPKPQGMAIVIAVIATSSILSLFTLSEARHFFLTLIFDIIGRIIYSLVLIAFWKGRNWARIWLLVTSVLGLVSLLLLFRMPSHTPIRHLNILMEAALSAFLLYYLNTPTVKAYFRPNESSLTARG